MESGYREDRNKRLILVIDSDENNRYQVRELLSKEYDVLTVNDGEMGLMILRDRRYVISLVILDVNLQGMSAREFLEEYRENRAFSTIPVICISDGADAVREEIEALSLGVYSYMRKPLHPEILTGKIKNILNFKDNTIDLIDVEFDKVTDLYNKEAFFRKIKTLLEKNPQKSYDLLVGDIEDFGLVNQQYGMEMGNRVLRSIGRNLKTIEQEDHLVARLRDDIFAAFSVYDDTWSENDIQGFVDFLMENCPIKNLQMKFGIYKGVDHSMPVDEICNKALAALDSIRHQFGNTLALYDNKFVEQQRREREMELRFDAALHNHEFELWLQPKYEADSQRLCGAEALVRWRDSDGKLIAPNLFIPVFERDGLISQLDEFMFVEACKLQKRLGDRDVARVPISVNLSGASLHRPDSAQLYESIVKRIGVDPSLVPIEITESMAIKSENAKEFYEYLYKRGFSFHMDDFGSGYSSLASLQTMHFDAIKLDKSLIDFIGTPQGNSMLKHTIAFSKESGMQVVAEGVETREQKEFLMRMGCDYIQGFYYSAPLPLDAYEDILVQSEAFIKENEKEIRFSLLDRKEMIGIISNNMAETDAINKIVGAVCMVSREKGNYILSAANEAFMDIFQINKTFVEEVLQQQMINFVHYEDRPRFKRMFREAEAKPEQGAVLECRLSSENSLYWCRIHCYFLRVIDGRKEYYLYMTDKTAAHFNNEILAGVPGGFLIYHADEEEQIVFANSHLWDIFGCDTEEEFRLLVGNSFKGLVYPEDYPAVQESILMQVEQNNKKLDYVEYRIKRKDGELVTVSDFGHLVHTETDEDLYYVFISEKK
ncbi:MAG: EAL domain-containing protein [Acetatifactor sp.]|nr:EAL domain-containing protein [Acetatifactor sp.]